MKVVAHHKERSKLPFDILQSRHVLATTFAYFGCFDEVSYLMQKLSHSTRAYFINAGGLKAFLPQ